MYKDIQREFGSIKMWKADKGYGFAIPDGGGEDVFIHITRTEDKKALEPGTRISYALAVDRKSGKLAADDVRVE